MRSDRLPFRHAGAGILSLALLAGLVQACERDQPPVRVGVLADCVGAARSLRDATMSGAELPLLQRGATLRGAKPGDGVTPATIAGRPVERRCCVDRWQDRGRLDR
jgi:hypothetical protein